MSNGTSEIEVKVDGATVDSSVPFLEMIIDERLMMPSQLTLTVFGLTPEEISVTGLKVGAMIEATVILDRKRTDVFKGKASSVDFDDQGGGPQCRVRAFDALHTLTNGTNTQVFQQMKSSDIMRKVISGAGLTARVAATRVVHEHVWQAAENDFDFLVRMAAQSGQVIRAEGETVIVEGLPKATSGKKGSHGLRAAPGDFEATVGVNVFTWTARTTQAEVVKKVVVTGWDPKQQAQVKAAVAPSHLFVDNAFKLRGKTELQAVLPVSTAAEAQEEAISRAEAVGALRSELSLTLDGDPAIRVGKVISFGKVGPPYDGRYVATHVVHRLDHDGMATDVESTSLADRSLLGAFTKGLDDRGGHQSGLVVATVTNVEDPENRGRVKVKYPWLDAEVESHWARVLHMGAGKGKGLMILPAVNDEVLVAFEHGSINHPVVVGGTFNPKNKPNQPGYHAGEVSAHTWRSGSGHEISLIDKKGSEAITITSGDRDVVVKIDKKGRAVSVTTKTSAVNVNAGGAVSVNSKQDVTLKGTNVTIEAKASLKLKGAIGELAASGPLVVKGAVIKLN